MNRSSQTILLLLVGSPILLAGCSDDNRGNSPGTGYHGGGYYGSGSSGGGARSGASASPRGGFGGFGHFGGFGG